MDSKILNQFPKEKAPTCNHDKMNVSVHSRLVLCVIIEKGPDISINPNILSTIQCLVISDPYFSIVPCVWLLNTLGILEEAMSWSINLWIHDWKNHKGDTIDISFSIVLFIINEIEAQLSYVFCYKLITYDNCMLVCPKWQYNKNEEIKLVPWSPPGASPFCLSWRAMTARNRKQRKRRVPWRQSLPLNYRGSLQYRML